MYTVGFEQCSVSNIFYYKYDEDDAADNDDGNNKCMLSVLNLIKKKNLT